MRANATQSLKLWASLRNNNDHWTLKKMQQDYHDGFGWKGPSKRGETKTICTSITTDCTVIA
eukprot:2942117-Amphidinium_carterae.1